MRLVGGVLARALSRLDPSRRVRDQAIDRVRARRAARRGRGRAAAAPTAVRRRAKNVRSSARPAVIDVDDLDDVVARLRVRCARCRLYGASARRRGARRRSRAVRGTVSSDAGDDRHAGVDRAARRGMATRTAPSGPGARRGRGAAADLDRRDASAATGRRAVLLAVPALAARSRTAGTASRRAEGRARRRRRRRAWRAGRRVFAARGRAEGGSETELLDRGNSCRARQVCRALGRSTPAARAAGDGTVIPRASSEARCAGAVRRSLRPAASTWRRRRAADRARR